MSLSRPVVEQDDAEEMVVGLGQGDGLAQSAGAPPTTKPSSASMSSRALGPKTGVGSVGGFADRSGGRCRFLTPPRCRSARGIRSAGVSSSASMAPESGRKIRPTLVAGAHWRRSRHSRRQRGASPSGRRRGDQVLLDRQALVAVTDEVPSQVRAVVHDSRPRARKALSEGAAHASAKERPAPSTHRARSCRGAHRRGCGPMG